MLTFVATDGRKFEVPEHGQHFAVCLVKRACVMALSQNVALHVRHVRDVFEDALGSGEIGEEPATHVLRALHVLGFDF